MATTASLPSKRFVLLLHLLLQFWSLFAESPSLVEFLPGFQGPLPFHFETGYVGVGESGDVQLFYYFIKSEKNPREDPLLLWLTGGPGCSAFSGLVFEIGPLRFEVVEYNGSLPSLVYNPHSWTQASSIILVDLPVGTGFSYAKTSVASQTGDFKQISNADQFLRKWLREHPEFLSHPVYVGGDSYSGITVPAIALEISNGNEEGRKPVVNLKGCLVGNPVTDSSIEGNSKIPYAHGMGLISDELFEQLKRSCGEEYQVIDPTNAECLQHLKTYSECIAWLNVVHILEPLCGFASPRPVELLARRRSIREFLDFKLPVPEVGCRTYAYLLGKYWMDDNGVRKALGIREGTIREWVRCNYGIPYSHNIHKSVGYHSQLTMKGYRALAYSGDHDMVVPFLGTQGWIRTLNYSIVDDWRQWSSQGQIAGYTRTYSNQLTFATVKGAGHTAPEYKPAECLDMYSRWMAEEPL
uniref:Serine carboxypeptidase n=3 Tax=Rhizophora mucronata TaxID=61149 RepID=A0A2P2M3K6_RHIMU